MKLVLGIDTSCYTTSVAAVDLENNLIGEHRQLLKVPAGERGLQQSQAVFQHIQNLPEAISKLLTQLPEAGIAAVAASTRPRPWEGSYMPVFIVSGSQGRILAQILRVPFWESSHQEGHLLAGLWSCGKKIPDQFLAVHLSGGTSEILRVTYLSTSAQLGGNPGRDKDLHADSSSSDWSTDGISFPAGPSLKSGSKCQGKGGAYSLQRGWI